MNDKEEKNLREYLEHNKELKDSLSNLINSFKILIKGMSCYPSDSYLCSKSEEFCNYLKEEKKSAQLGINRLERKLGKN